MRNTYYVKRINLEKIRLEDVWVDIPTLYINNYPWDINKYRPNVEAKVFYTDTHLHVRFRAFEDTIRAECRNLNDMVCRDSCMELFLNPNPDADNRYLNFEMNPIGTLLLCIGGGSFDRIPAVTVEDLESFNILTSVSKESFTAYKGPFWEIAYRIPFAYLERHYGKMDFCIGKRIKANFYACGNDTEFSHYACWSNIVNETPDFHRPEFFGDLVLA